MVTGKTQIQDFSFLNPKPWQPRRTTQQRTRWTQKNVKDLIFNYLAELHTLGVKHENSSFTVENKTR